MAFKIKLAATLSAALMLTPAVSLAAFSRTSTSTPVSGSNFCTLLPSLVSQLNSKLTSADSNLSNKQQQHLQSLQQLQTKRTQDLANLRANDDQARTQIYQQLEAKATTTAAQLAVKQFETAMNTAITARKAAVDAALQTYWTGMQNIFTARQTAVSTAEKNFVTAVQTALTNAITACNSGTAPATVRQTLLSALSAARSKFNSDRQSIDKTGPQIKTLVQTRNAAVKKAMSDFHTAAEAARTALKAALKTTSSSSHTATSTTQD